ncbi:geranylgeranyl diphosphate synthase type I [Kitasatospora sp. GAS204A]|uniref:polyprenyl synthetase family protein n=1 Tax=unclassified Kitasatospora TaxID=2633591 RepID=UPI002475D13E|nr:polyprenyl synthetase family protein [Kitasatospora sp. GAS204B]MDH6118843.1 geranylgeranyl diphosphate synthase type I [Kitasatospora sp. GAS204B]
MTDTLPETALPDLVSLRDQVGAALTGFLHAKDRNPPGIEVIHLTSTLRKLLSGGKRLRSVLCLYGWHAAGATGDATAVVRAAASLELFQAFALVHDDVMDNSDIRRGTPSAHRALAAAYSADGGPRDRAQAYGLGAAILLGDLALVWSGELLHTAGLDPDRLAQVLPLVHDMRSEVMYGQLLDLQTTGRLSADIDTPLHVIRYKTAKYTIERPLHIGAALAGAGAPVLDACTAFGIPLGEAFQLRDDLLGVFGDPAETGKAIVDDLREGKATVLMALAVQRASAAQLSTLRSLVGRSDLNDEQAAEVREVLESTGARQAVERMITTRYDAALTALDQAPFPEAVSAGLRRLAQAATTRQM